MIVFDVVDRSGERKSVEIPEGINLSLMEVLKASDYPVLATCGGLALCATCQVEVVKGIEQLDDPSDLELEMLDQLPSGTPVTRLACQIKLMENLNGAVFQLGREA
jgi:ferredoxin